MQQGEQEQKRARQRHRDGLANDRDQKGCRNARAHADKPRKFRAHKEVELARPNQGGEGCSPGGKDRASAQAVSHVSRRHHPSPRSKKAPAPEVKVKISAPRIRMARLRRMI